MGGGGGDGSTFRHCPEIMDEDKNILSGHLFVFLLFPVMNAASAGSGCFVMPEQASFVWPPCQAAPETTWHWQEVYHYPLKAFTTSREEYS